MRLFPAWMFESYPWANDVLSWLKWANDIWHEFQSVFFLVALAFLWWLLRHERVRLSERIGTLQQLVTAIQDQSEQALAQPILDATAQSPDSKLPTGQIPQTAETFVLGNWSALRYGWRDVRDRIELLIEGIGRSRVRGKYSRMPRRRYRDIINALENDGELTPKVATELLSMEAQFNDARFKPKSVSDMQVARFRTSYDLVTKFLPKLPDNEGASSVPAEQPMPQTQEQTQSSAA